MSLFVKKGSSMFKLSNPIGHKYLGRQCPKFIDPKIMKEVQLDCPGESNLYNSKLFKVKYPIEGNMDELEELIKIQRATEQKFSIY